METTTSQSQNQSVSYPNQPDPAEKALASIASLLKEADQLLPMLRREFRGEAVKQYQDGTFEYIQISKPIFVKLNVTTEEPIKIGKVYKDGTTAEVYVPNDEAIEEVISILKFMGLNNITRLTNIDEGTILDDLREYECKLASVLMLKQKEWGIDKELLPMTMSKIKTIVQDARYMCCNGSTLKAIQKTVQRVESFIEGDKGRKRLSPYN